jgi:hypothetical protein
VPGTGLPDVDELGVGVVGRVLDGLVQALVDLPGEGVVTRGEREVVAGAGLRDDLRVADEQDARLG